MTIADLRLADGAVHPLVTDAPLPERFDELGAAGVMACAPKPVDPMEKVFHAMALHIRPRRASLAGSSRLVWPYPLTSTLLAGSQVWPTERGAGLVLTAQVDATTTAGLRVLGVAEAAFARELPASQRDSAFRFRGLVGLADPLRAALPEAVVQCRSAGIRVIMVPADYPATAEAIARQAGLNSDMMRTGTALARHWRR